MRPFDKYRPKRIFFTQQMGESEEIIMSAREEKINALFNELVPASGKADTIAGEIIRAVSRIGYRNYNDGDHIGVRYGKETCNPAARYLASKAGTKVSQVIFKMWGIEDDRHYQKMLVTLEESVLEYLEQHPDLKTTANSEDMWNYWDKNEDIDDYEDEEDENYD